MKPHEADGCSRRRFSLGLLGAGIGGAVLLAPKMSRSARLDVELRVVHPGATIVEVDGVSKVTEIGVRLESHMDEPLDPLFSTWDRKRKTRHNWEIASGAVPLPPGETSAYHLVAPGPEAGLTPGMRAQVTVYQRDTQHWRSTHFRVGGADD